MVCEQLGYFEEYLLPIESGYPKCLGVLMLENNLSSRVLGYGGRQERTLTEPITLTKGHRKVTYKASKQKPLRVVTMLQRLEGRRL